MVHMAVGWLLSVSFSVDDVLFKLVIREGAVGWQLEVSLMVDVCCSDWRWW